MSKITRILSLGAGVQSSTLALMAARGEIGPMPDYAIFADVGDEPKSVYKYLNWLETQLPFPVIRTTRGTISIDVMAGDKAARPPLFTEGGGMLGRQCTSNYKIAQIKREVRKLLGVSSYAKIPDGSVEMWIGISTDEIQRMKDADVKYLKHRWPLIENNLSRKDCLAWFAKHNLPLPGKSSCVFCPYKTNLQWRDMKENDPESWQAAVEFDKGIRTPRMVELYNAKCFVHSSLVPLDEANLEPKRKSKDQIEFGFLQECDGMCGV